MTSPGPHSPEDAAAIRRGPVIAAVLVHVADIDEAAAWYARVLPDAVPAPLDDDRVRALRIVDVQMEFVVADEKGASGAAGSVVYWAVDDLTATLHRLAAMGITPYRGPMRIEAGQGMVQVRDPWGNCVGLRGPCEGMARPASLP